MDGIDTRNTARLLSVITVLCPVPFRKDGVVLIYLSRPVDEIE